MNIERVSKPHRTLIRTELVTHDIVASTLNDVIAEEQDYLFRSFSTASVIKNDSLNMVLLTIYFEMRIG